MIRSSISVCRAREDLLFVRRLPLLGIGKARVQSDEQYYARRVQQELDLAAATADKSVKAIHLNMAARYATMGEKASATRGGSEALDGVPEPARQALRTPPSKMEK
jgi:hypothetical protein